MISFAHPNVSFEVEEGSIFAFLGPNGAGKSTTINTLCTIFDKTSGTLTIDGKDVTHEKDEVRSVIGVVLSAATIATLQGIIILIIGYFIGLQFTSWITPFAVIGVMIVVGLVFSGLGLFLATLVKNSQTFQVVITAITMPLTFLCGAYIPLSMLQNLCGKPTPSGVGWIA